MPSACKSVGAGLDPGLWPTPGDNLLGALVVPSVGAFNDPIREIHAVSQCGYDPYHFQGRDLVADLKAAWAQSNQGVGQAAFTLLGLHAAGAERGDATLEEVISQLQTSQFASGGWSCWGLPSPDGTGFALVALAAEDAFLQGTAERMRVWLDANRLANGGYYASGGHIGSLTVAGVPVLDAEGANTQSTIWAIHGYRALGDVAPAASMAYLLSRQMPDGGFAWRDADTRSDAWATMEVVAGWRQSFQELPEYAEAPVVAPGTVSVGIPAAFELAGFTEVAWRRLDAAGTTLLGARSTSPSRKPGPPSCTSMPPGTAPTTASGSRPPLATRRPRSRGSPRTSRRRATPPSASKPLPPIPTGTS